MRAQSPSIPLCSTVLIVRLNKDPVNLRVDAFTQKVEEVLRQTPSRHILSKYTHLGVFKIKDLAGLVGVVFVLILAKAKI
jgi:hypothetical protein